MFAKREHLFSGLDYHQVRDSFDKNIANAIDAIDPTVFASADPNELVTQVEADYRMEPPRLQEEDITTQVNDAEVSGVDAWGEPFRGRGLQIDFFVPFEGDSRFFGWTPSSFNYNRPPGAVQQNKLCLTYRRSDHDAEAARREFDTDLANIRTYLDTWATDSTSFNASIRSLILKRIERRRAKIAQDQEFAKRLGFPQK